MKSDFINCKNCTDDCHCKGKDITPICISFKPAKTTNADRIRSMTDEDLAEFIANAVDCCNCSHPRNGCSENDETCADCWLDWLKQEAISDG